MSIRIPTDDEQDAAAEHHAGIDDECPVCRGYGHFWEDGKPTLNKNARKCLDCSGTGKRLTNTQPNPEAGRGRR